MHFHASAVRIASPPGGEVARYPAARPHACAGGEAASPLRGGTCRAAARPRARPLAWPLWEEEGFFYYAYDMRVSNVIEMKRNLELYQTLFLDLKSTLKLLHRGATWIFGVVPNTFLDLKSTVKLLHRGATWICSSRVKS
jgi:hypothetical protein